MKLAFCLFNYFPYGGLQQDFLMIAKTCLARGHEIDVYTMSWEGEVPDGIQLFLLKKQGLTNHSRARNFSKQVAAILTKTHYDRVVGFNKIEGLDIYFSADTCFVAQDKYQKSFLKPFHPRFRTYALLEGKVFGIEEKTRVLILTLKQKKEYQAAYHTPDERFYLLPPGIHKHHIRPAHADETRLQYRTQLNIHSDTFVLLFIGSYFKTKGLDRALFALASLPDAMKRKTLLLVAGEGKTKKYEKIIKKFHLENKIQFLGKREDIPNLLLTADLLIHPARVESAGKVILEALVSGLPVLVTENCGYAHYIHDAKSGEVISLPFEQKKINQSLLSMLNQSCLKQYHENALTYAKQTDLFSMAEQAANYILL